MKEKFKELLIEIRTLYDKAANLVEGVEDEEIKEQLNFCLCGLGVSIDNFEEEIELL